jgi:DNA-directed RNA polymerase specialized sigma24 family protein
VKTEVEEEIKTGLKGDEHKQHEAVCKAYERFANPLASYIRESVAPTLDEHELTTAVNNVFLDLAKKAKKGGFASDGSLKSLLFTMAKYKALDQLEAKLKQENNIVPEHPSSDASDNHSGETLTEDEIVSIVAGKLSDAPQIATAWKAATQDWTAGKESAAREIVRRFKIWIGTSLPPMQRKVAELIAASFGEFTDEEICERLKKAGHSAPLGSVKSARREIREKFASLINQLERTEKP